MAVFQGIQILTLTVIPCMMIAAISFLALDTAMVVVSLVLSIFMYGFFFETHPDPDSSPSDAANMIRLEDFPEVLDGVLRAHAAAVGS